MAACSLFDEDEVCLITPDKGYVYGLVVENAEFISSDEENDELPGQITKGSVRVAWHPDGKETVVEENKVILVDRSLMPGDVVRHVDDNEDSQAGFVEDMSVTCHLHILGTDKYIYNVNSKNLIYPKYDSDPGDVTFDSWLGRIDAVNEIYIVKFPDGARCAVSDEDICMFEDITDKRCRHTEFCNQGNYPSQELKATMRDLSGSKWLTETPAYNSSVAQSKPKMNIHVTVEEVQTDSVDVHWLCRGLAKVENPLFNTETPPKQVSGDNLNRLHTLNWFSHCSAQIGDEVEYIIPDTSVLNTVPLKHFAKPLNLDEIHVHLQPDNAKHNVHNSSTKASDALKKAKAHCECNGDDDGEDADDDADDDSSDDSSSSSSSSESNSSNASPKKRKNARKGPRLATKSMKKVKGRRAKKKFNFPERILRAGDKVTAEVCYTFSKANIRWQDASQMSEVPSIKLYPIHHLDALEFFPGDFVSDTRDDDVGDYGVVVSSNHKDRTCMVQWMKMYDVGKGNVPTRASDVEEVSVYDIVDHLEYKFRTGYNVIRVGGFHRRDEVLPAVGQVFSLTNDGTIVVKWSDGQISSCYPQDLYVSSDLLDDFSDSDLESDDSSDDDDEEDSDESWETENEEDVIEGEVEVKESEELVEKKAIPFLSEDQNTDVVVLMNDLPAELGNLESLFIYLNENTTSLTSQYREILQMYSSCKYLDKMLKTAYFKEEDLTDLIAIMKSEIKREKYKKITSRFENLYLSWYQNVSCLENETAPMPPRDQDLKSDVIYPETDTSAEGACALPVSECEKHPVAAMTFHCREAACLAGESLSGGDSCLTGEKLSAGDCCPSLDEPKEASHVAVKVTSSEELWESGTPVIVSSALIKGDHSAKELCLNVLKKLHECFLRLKVEVDQYREKFDEKVENEATPQNEAGTQTEAGSQIKVNMGDAETQTEEGVKIEYCMGDAGIQSEAGAQIKVHMGDGPETEVAVIIESCMGDAGTQMQNGAGSRSPGNRSPGSRSPGSRSPGSRSPAIRRQIHNENHVSKNAQLHEPFALSCEVSIKRERISLNQPFAVSCEESIKAESISPNLSLVCDYGTQTGTISTSEVSTQMTNNATSDLNFDELSKQRRSSSDESLEKFQMFVESRLKTCEDSLAQLVDDDIPRVNGASCATESQDDDKDMEVTKGFELVDEALLCHRFHSSIHSSISVKTFNTAIIKELRLLKTSLPPGIHVKGFADRLDLFSIMIVGPKKTPYEDGLFFFDVQLPADYPSSPPLFFYYSFCVDRLNPNLYDDGKVCISLLGTWAGKGNEVWTSKSNLLQVLISIQGLILVSEPYYNEAGYEKQRGTSLASENSRMYNEMAILKLVQSLTNMVNHPPKIFEKETRKHLQKFGPRIIHQLDTWMKLSDLKSSGETSSLSKPSEAAQHSSVYSQEQSHVQDSTCVRKHISNDTNTIHDSTLVKEEVVAEPDFPLLPVSKGFRLTLKHHLAQFRKSLEESNPGCLWNLML